MINLADTKSEYTLSNYEKLLGFHTGSVGRVAAAK